MTENRNNGGPAFPQHDLSGYGLGPATDGDRYLVDGMSLRDWFAGQALAGLMATQGDANGWFKPGNAAVFSYEIADAMLATRSSSKEA